MKVLFVAPVQQGSGETMTVLHMARQLVASGHQVRFLAAEFAGRFLRREFDREVLPLSGSGPINRARWEEALVTIDPDAVVFADYPLLFFPGVAPLAAEPGWIESLDHVRACLVTLDHFGFAQHPMGVWMGPAHLTLAYQWIPALPERFRILLPCPMHEPSPVEERRGDPFRYWDVPLSLDEDRRRAVRRRYLGDEDGFLVAHLVSNWAWRGSEAYGLSFYRHLFRLLEGYLGPAEGRVTVVSVNNGHLLLSPPQARLSLVNTGLLPPDEFETLLLGADLVLTENRVSISVGKAVCGLRTAAVLKNSYRLLDLLERAETGVREVVQAMENAQPGTIYPYDVFPTGMVQELKDLVLYRDNSLTQAFAEVEVFGGSETSRRLCRLLGDPEERDRLRLHQKVYVDRVAALDDVPRALARLVDEERSAR